MDLSHYLTYDEAARLQCSARGVLTRVRTWDIFERLLPRTRVLDVGGGPGVHAEHLASQGSSVILVDPMPNHASQARARAVRAVQADARTLPFADACFDSVLLMGPLYHLDGPGRALALGEAHRVLRPNGLLFSEVITRHAWIIDATAKGLLVRPDIWESFDWNLRTGLSQDPSTPGFKAYFHRVDEIAPELTAAGFEVAHLLAVEGFPWAYPNLPQLLEDPRLLLDAIRLTEAEPSMLGISPHVMAVSVRA